MNFSGPDALFDHLRRRWSQPTLRSAALMTYVAAATSDQDADQQLRREGQGTLDRLLGIPAVGLARTSTVFEIGCGPGRVATAMVEYLSAGRYHGFDLSPQFVDIARRRCPKGAFSVTDGCRFPVGVGQADLVLEFSVFCHQPFELVFRWLRECVRVLAPRGRMCLQFHNLAHPASVAEFNANADEWRFVTDPGYPRAMTWDTVERLHRMAGLRISGVERFDVDESTGEPRSWFVIAEAAA